MLYIEQVGKRVMGTTRRREAVDKDHLYLDLSEDPETWQCPWSISAAVICAGVTKLNACKSDPASSAHVNIKGISALVKNLVSKGAFVIYLSSNQVFDGSMPYHKSNDPLSPVTEYGRQKAETERQITQFGDSVAIVRITKVLGPTDLLFSGWRDALRNRKVIHPFSDMFMAPVPLSCVVTVLSLIGDLRLPGIIQVSGNRDVSYAEIAKLGSRLLGANETLVQPILSSQSDSYSECVLAHTTLDISRLKATLGIVPPDVSWTIEMAFTNPLSLRELFMSH